MRQINAQSIEILAIVLISIFSLALLTPYIFVQFEMSLNTNHAWLLVAAQRFLEGGTPLEDFFEPNPPMSIVLYIPQYLMHSLFGIPLAYVPALFGYLCLAFSGFITFRLLQTLLPAAPKTISALMLGFISAAIFIPNMIYFSDRDYFVFIALFPLMLGQIAITQKLPLPPIKTRLLFLFAGLVLLVKPHYGLYPAILLLHRLCIEKNIYSIIKSPDFQGLSASFVVYIVLIFSIFPQYALYVFPHFIELYIGQRYEHIINDLIYYSCLIGVFLLAVLFIPLSDQIRKIIFMLCGAALLGLFLFWLQGKGFFYHAIPALGFYFIALIAFLTDIFSKIFQRFHWHRLAPIYALQCMVCLILGYYFSPPLKDFPTHEDYKNLPLSKVIRACDTPCPFLILSANMDIISQVSLYTGQKHILRFPSVWWITEVQNQPERNEMKNTLIKYVAEDIARHKPKIILSRIDYGENSEIIFDYAGYLSKESAEMREQLSHYEKAGTMKDNIRYYFTGTAMDIDLPVHYDIYYLKQPAQ